MYDWLIIALRKPQSGASGTLAERIVPLLQHPLIVSITCMNRSQETACLGANRSSEKLARLAEVHQLKLRLDAIP